jgi:hypothetical protein
MDESLFNFAHFRMDCCDVTNFLDCVGSSQIRQETRLILSELDGRRPIKQKLFSPERPTATLKNAPNPNFPDGFGAFQIFQTDFPDGILQMAFLQMEFCRWILQMAFSPDVPRLFLRSQSRTILFFITNKGNKTELSENSFKLTNGCQ